MMINFTIMAAIILAGAHSNNDSFTETNLKTFNALHNKKVLSVNEDKYDIVIDGYTSKNKRGALIRAARRDEAPIYKYFIINTSRPWNKLRLFNVIDVTGHIDIVFGTCQSSKKSRCVYSMSHIRARME